MCALEPGALTWVPYEQGTGLDRERTLVPAQCRAYGFGASLLMAAPSFTISANLVRDLPYDTVRDFAPVGQATTGHYIVVVHPSLPVHSLKQLVALAKARPGQLNFGSGGNGNSTHLAAEYFR